MTISNNGPLLVLFGAWLYRTVLHFTYCHRHITTCTRARLTALQIMTMISIILLQHAYSGLILLTPCVIARNTLLAHAVLIVPHYALLGHN